MKRAWGLGPAVDGGAADCPTCGRKKGLACAVKARGKTVIEAHGHWIGASRRYHPARINAAIAARQAREQES